MATRYFCDGCDEEVSDKRMFMVRISTSAELMQEMEACHGRGAMPTNYKQFHLCETCERTLRRDADPTNWARAVRAA